MTNHAHGVLCVVLLVGALASCSGEDPDVSSDRTRPVTPSLDQTGAAIERTEDVMSAAIAAGGVPTTYRAYFTGEQAVRIAEVRANAAGEPARADYEFHGARLLKYSGQSLTGSSLLDLELDLQGRVLVARAGARSASAEEISEIRERAQLLRSHALARRASRTHGVN